MKKIFFILLVICPFIVTAADLVNTSWGGKDEGGHFLGFRFITASKVLVYYNSTAHEGTYTLSGNSVTMNVKADSAEEKYQCVISGNTIEGTYSYPGGAPVAWKLSKEDGIISYDEFMNILTALRSGEMKGEKRSKENAWDATLVVDGQIECGSVSDHVIYSQVTFLFVKSYSRAEAIAAYRQLKEQASLLKKRGWKEYVTEDDDTMHYELTKADFKIKITSFEMSSTGKYETKMIFQSNF